jgi:uncharacterized OsmC-like protein
MDRPPAHSVRERQDPLRQRYSESKQPAWITDRGRAVDGVRTDPFHGQAVAGSQNYGVVWPFGIHTAVGGYHDAPNPGDLLCTALAICLDSTLRIIAERLGVQLLSLEVDVTGDIDVRGTLQVDRTVPVGFQQMRCAVSLEPAPGTDPELLRKLLAASERSCVNLQTLRAGVPVETSLSINSLPP